MQTSPLLMIELENNDAMQRAINRAKQCHPKVTVLDVATRAYRVTNSKRDGFYTVRFAVSAGKKLAACDCKAGQSGMICFHAAAAAAVNIGLHGTRAVEAKPTAKTKSTPLPQGLLQRGYWGKTPREFYGSIEI